jgi:SEC-C motif domain protein
MLCACGSQKEYAACCEPYIEGKLHAPTAEALMRSRYTAHVLAKVSYIRDTLAPEKRNEFDEEAAHKWATESEWLGLQILKSEEQAKRATVEFVVSFNADEKLYEHHEVAQFRKDPDERRWYFVDGDAKLKVDGQEQVATTQYVREGPKVGRNDPCPCGSGKKYKKCCGK